MPDLWSDETESMVADAFRRVEARRGPGRHRRCYSGEWPVLVELGMPRAEVAA